MITFNLASSSRVVWFPEDELDVVFFSLIFVVFGDELFPVIQIDRLGGSAISQSPL